MINTTVHARVFGQKLVNRFPNTEFMTPAEVLEHRLIAIPGIVGADVGPATAVEGCEPYCTIVIERASGYSLQALIDAESLIKGPQCCPKTSEFTDELLEAV